MGPPEGASFPQTFEIDYVRVFQCENANPDTGRGCGTGDRTIEPLEDNDGGPLEDVPTDNPFVERLDLFVDGPEAITISTPDGDATNQIGIDGFTGDGATVIGDPAFADPDDPTNTVWRVAISGATSNVFLTSQVFEDDPFLETGFDFSGGRVPGEGTDPFGEVAFEMEVVSIDPGATILIGSTVGSRISANSPFPRTRSPRRAPARPTPSSSRSSWTIRASSTAAVVRESTWRTCVIRSCSRSQAVLPRSISTTSTLPMPARSSAAVVLISRPQVFRTSWFSTMR